MSTFEQQVLIWAEIQRERKERETREREARFQRNRLAEIRAAIAESVPKGTCLTKKSGEVEALRSRVDLYDRVSKNMTRTIGQLKRKVERRRRARAEAKEITFSPSMVAHRVWERTGRCDWAAVVRMEGLSGLDIMDFTITNAQTIAGLEDPKSFCEALWAIRDDLTRPIAELLYQMRDNDGDPETDWFSAQRLLRSLFARGLSDPTEARLAAAQNVADRFTPVALDVRTRSVVTALKAALT